MNIKKNIRFIVIYIAIKWLIIGIIAIYFYKSDYWNDWYFALFPVVGFLLYKTLGARLLKREGSNPGYKKYFINEIKNRYPSNFEILISETDKAFLVISADIRFASKSKNPMDRRLNFAAYFLSLIKVLERHDESYTKIKEVCLKITSEYVKPKNKFQAWKKRLPPKLINTIIAKPLLAFMSKKFGTKGHQNGFVAQIITDKNKTYGFGYGLDIIECGICKLFDKHEAAKYKTILCEVDKLTSSLAGLELVRKGTLADGSEKCDFRYKRIIKRPFKEYISKI